MKSIALPPKINDLIDRIHTLEGDTKVVMEHTGRYYEPMAHWLSNADLFVSAVNPKLIKEFGNSLHKIKTDKANAVKLHAMHLTTGRI